MKNASLIITIHRHADRFHCHTSRSDYTLSSSGKTLIYSKHCIPLRGYYEVSADGNTLTDHVSVAGQERLVRVYARLTGPSLKALKRQGRWFLAAINGRQIGPFDQLRSLSDGQYAARSDGNWRVYTQEGDLGSSFVWKDIQPLVPGRYVGKNSKGKWQLLASTGQPVSRFMWNDIKAMPKGTQR